MDIGRLHHVGMVVDDIDAAAQQLSAALGVDFTVGDESSYRCRIHGEVHLTTQRLGLSSTIGPHIELLRSVPGSEVWSPAPGIHHLGYEVDDLPSASALLTERGLPLWVQGLHEDGSAAGTAYHRTPAGPTIELLDRATVHRLASRFRCCAVHLAADPDTNRPTPTRST
ncbi:glyoxalase family protein [Gordonia neofelifaecis NRRL B-59395]|uniref:Glyoxalase family protein n=1 Tax=Gordonia neofelifaecis NRRL B-59395 TaxID=644548 RepID=F1YPG2_9ACTN|nr:glyoxalase family protein [Gordonia neofelifaecis NRRL B-59395]